MAAKFPPSLFCDVEKGPFRAFSRADAVDVLEIDMNSLDPVGVYSYGFALSSSGVSRSLSE
jgi:hypothetical protein